MQRFQQQVLVMERLQKILAICGCTMAQSGLMLVKYKGRKVQQEHKVLQGHKAPLVLTELKALLEQMAHKA
jgi:hypothetical protein